MKILYAIQGTGNGHISRARDIIPELQKKGELDILISGIQSDVKLDIPIKFQLKGLSFIFGKKGGVDLARTFFKNNTRRLIKEIKNLPVNDYDIIINDFEPVSAWAAQLRGKACIGLSHQNAVLSLNAPQPKKTDLVGKLIMKYYAPCDYKFGFHFKSYNTNTFTPVIRSQIRSLKPTDEGHYTVYLPAYDDEQIIKRLKIFKNTKWQVFSKHNKVAIKHKNIHIRPIDNEAFIKSLASAKGVLCGAGFETPAEALFLKKKLMVIPMKGQYEQQCNAAALKELGVHKINSLKKKHLPKIEAWLSDNSIVEVNYPDKTSEIIDTIFDNHFSTNNHLLRLEQNSSLELGYA